MVRTSSVFCREYNIGVSGCGKRATYVVIRPQNPLSCFGGGGRTEVY